RHIADVLGLQGREEVLGRKPGVHPEPELPSEPLQVAERGEDEIQPASGRVRISFPKAPGQEITLLTPKHEWVVAADPVMAIVGAAGLMPMDLDGERVQIQHEAAWCIPAKSPFGHGEQDRPESRAVLIAREVFQEARERGLGGEPLGSPSRGRAERGVAPSPRDRNAKERIMAQQCGISVLAPPLALEQDLGAEEFQPRVRDARGVARIAQVAPQKTRESGPVHERAQEERAGISAEALGTRLDVNGTVEIRLEKCSLNFTHGVFFRAVRRLGWFAPPTYGQARRYAMGFLCPYYPAAISIVNKPGLQHRSTGPKMSSFVTSCHSSTCNGTVLILVTYCHLTSWCNDCRPLNILGCEIGHCRLRCWYWCWRRLY